MTKRILIIEDQEDNRAIMRDLLSGAREMKRVLLQQPDPMLSGNGTLVLLDQAEEILVRLVAAIQKSL
jgi:CheY-like chemotaxis protein